MQMLNTDHVVFEESYLLGWSVQPSKVLLFVQVLLTPKHRAYTAHDEEREFGCYRLAVLTVEGVTSTEGIEGKRPPCRAETVEEFHDIDEINELGVRGNALQLAGDETEMLIVGESARLDILMNDSLSAFWGLLPED